MIKKIGIISVIIFFVGLIFFVFRESEENYSEVEHSVNEVFTSEYIGSLACSECHSEAFEQWKTSDHYRAMLPADETSVLGDFNNQTLEADGIISKFFKKGGKFFINTQDENGNYRDFEVLYTFGHYPLQQYLTAFDGGRLQVFRQSWDSRENKWFHQYEKQKIPHKDWLHWTGNAQNWNMMCASCHSVNLQKNYDPKSDAYQTHYQEVNVACESCHGAGKKHAQVMKENPNFTQKNKFIKTAKNSEQELKMCFSCHARRGELTQFHSDFQEIMDEYIPEIPATPLYFADGQMLDEVYKYASFLQSKMYKAGVKCTDCHNPHTGKLKTTPDKLCLQCHTPFYATQKHTFHQENTSASDCRSCHMPTRTYMGNDIRHDHNFAVPRPDLSAKYNVPNACNSCHENETALWAAQNIEKWYGKERKSHFAEDLILGSLQNEKSIEHLSKLLTDPQTPDIIRATSVHYLGGIFTRESFSLILKELHHPDPQTRYRAVMALLNFNTSEVSQQIQPLLIDKIRAVRVAAANWFLTQLGFENAQKIPNFSQALQEFETFVLSQSDFAVGSATAGDYYVKIGQPYQAILFYERAISKDNQLNYIRLNLANLYNTTAQNEKSLQILEEALIFEPKNPQIHYYLALLFNEMNELQKSKNHFEMAMKLGMNSERLQRNYQLLLERMRN